MSESTPKARITIITAIVTAVITGTITVGIPEMVKAVKPVETINVVLSDLREKEPEGFDRYVESELLKKNQVVMEKAEDVLTFRNASLDYYTLGTEKFISLSDLARIGSGTIEVTAKGQISLITQMPASTAPPSVSGVTGQDWLEVCPPYEMGNFSAVLAADNNTMTIAGEEHTSGLLSKAAWKSQALFNLHGNFQELVVSAGHIDGSTMQDCTYCFYVDGEKVQTVTLKADQLLTEISVPLNYGQQLSFECSGSGSYAYYGFVNGIFR